MLQYAVFVDAGYLFAAGGATLAGRPVVRSEVTLDCPQAVNLLVEVGNSIVGYERLLRIYWYDAQPRGRHQTYHDEIRDLDNVKLRLGHLNSQRQQKGVDSLIVTDMIELARQRSISDAVLLAGDGDLTVGVAIAQSFGTRVHLMGMGSRTGNQSPELFAEADVTVELANEQIGQFLTITGQSEVLTQSILDAIDAFIGSVPDDSIEGLKERLNLRHRGIPIELDRQLLAHCRTAKGDDLTDEERARMRVIFRANILEL